MLAPDNATVVTAGEEEFPFFSWSNGFPLPEFQSSEHSGT